MTKSNQEKVRQCTLPAENWKPYKQRQRNWGRIAVQLSVTMLKLNKLKNFLIKSGIYYIEFILELIGLNKKYNIKKQGK